MSGTITFPPNPTDGQQYTAAGVTWQWSASKGAWVNANTGANFVPLTGGTMTGGLVLSGNAPATAPLQAVPLQQAQQLVLPAENNVGRNLLHNSMMGVQQRGAGPFTVFGSYTADRWLLNGSADTASVSLTAMGSVAWTAIGDESAQFWLGVTFTGTAGGSTAMVQRIERVRRLSNKTVIVSGWAQGSAAGLSLGVSLDQNFGTGGSPSAQVNGNGVAASVQTTAARFVVSVTLPSTSSATLGTAGNDYTQLNLWCSSGTATATRAGIGVQSGTIFLWGLQCEIAAPGQTQPTPLEKLDPVLQLQQCQRFYYSYTGTLQFGFNSWAAGAFQAMPCSLPVTMRAAPSVVLGAGSAFNNFSSIATTNISPGGFFPQIAATTAGSCSVAVAGYTASADL